MKNRRNKISWVTMVPMILFLSICLYFLYYYCFGGKWMVERLDNKPVIPYKVYQTFNTKNLPNEIRKVIDTLKLENPEFEYFLYDDEDCRAFIETYFDSEVVEAYNRLVPGAFKSDLWRNCILYINGGIYLDIKLKPIAPFRLHTLTDKEYFVRDTDFSGGGVYNGLMVVKPKNTKLLQAINAIVDNCKSRFYGESPLEPTGPLLLKRFFNEDEFNNITLRFVDYREEDGMDTTQRHRYIDKDGVHIFEYDISAYASYKKGTKGYPEHWYEKTMYRD